MTDRPSYTLERDLELLEERKVDAFDIMGIERHEWGEFHGQRIHGYIDRVDRFAEGEVRVVDYKTGTVSDDEEKINDGNAARIAEKLFKDESPDRPTIALQFFIYDKLMEQEAAEGKILNSVYCLSNLFKEVPAVIPQSMEFKRCVEERLAGLIDDLRNPEVPFRRVEERKSQMEFSPCDWCDFKIICGR